MTNKQWLESKGMHKLLIDMNLCLFDESTTHRKPCILDVAAGERQTDCEYLSCEKCIENWLNAERSEKK